MNLTRCFERLVRNAGTNSAVLSIIIDTLDFLRVTTSAKFMSCKFSKAITSLEGRTYNEGGAGGKTSKGKMRNSSR